MRIAMVFSTPFPPEEGIGNYVWNLSRELRRNGHEIELFTRGARTRSWEFDGLPVHEARAPPVHPFHVQAHSRFLHRAFGDKLRRAEVVHLHSPLPPPIRTQAPKVLTFHTPVRADTRAISTWNRTSILYRLQTPFSVRIERALIERAAEVTAVSGSVLQDLAEYHIRAPASVVHNAVDPGFFTPHGPRGDTVLYTGRLGPRKGLFELIEALAHLRERGITPGLHMTGKGPFRAEIERHAQKLGVRDQLHMRGFVTRDELRDLLRSCGLYVFPSHYEGLPTSILEAMSTEAPIVATDAPGVIDLVDHERNALVVPVADPRALASAMERALGDPGLRARLGREARTDVIDHYSWPATAKTMMAVYERVAAR